MVIPIIAIIIATVCAAIALTFICWAVWCPEDRYTGEPNNKVLRQYLKLVGIGTAIAVVLSLTLNSEDIEQVKVVPTDIGAVRLNAVVTEHTMPIGCALDTSSWQVSHCIKLMDVKGSLNIIFKVPVYHITTYQYNSHGDGTKLNERHIVTEVTDNEAIQTITGTQIEGQIVRTIPLVDYRQPYSFGFVYILPISGVSEIEVITQAGDHYRFNIRAHQMLGVE